MPAVVGILPIILPLLVMSIAVVLLCFYGYAKKKAAAYDVTTSSRSGNNASVIHSISLSEDHSGEERHYDRFPPRYSTVDLPPPYSLFDPMLASICPGSPPPAYEMYPITLPLAPHNWMQRTPSFFPDNTHNHPHPQRPNQTPPHFNF